MSQTEALLITPFLARINSVGRLFLLLLLLLSLPPGVLLPLLALGRRATPAARPFSMTICSTWLRSIRLPPCLLSPLMSALMTDSLPPICGRKPTKEGGGT